MRPRTASTAPSRTAGDLQLRGHLARVVHRHQVFAPILDPADRPAQAARRERNEEVLRIELAARAEAAADIDLDEVDGFRLKAEHAGEHAPVEERHLDRAMQRQPSLRCVPVGQQPARLHGQGGVALDAEALAPRVVGAGECRVRIAHAAGEDSRAVGAGRLEQQYLVASGDEVVGDRRQLRDVEIDALERVLGDGRFARRRRPPPARRHSGPCPRR